MTPKICLNMILKNESKVIKRLLDSVKNIIDDYIIVDTGSTDNTKSIIENFSKENNIHGKVFDSKFKDFAYNRNEALNLAKENSQSDFLLLLDADMVLNTLNFNKQDLINKQVLKLKQKNSNIEWQNIRIINKKVNAKYIGVTHEYLDINNAKIEYLDSLFIEDYGDGGSKSDKFIRDINLLSEAIKIEPYNSRYYFYLAQSYKDIKQYDQALKYYNERIKLGGWLEEVWYSYYMISYIYIQKGQIQKAEEYAIKGFISYPYRSENIYLLVKYYRENKDYNKAYSYYLLGKDIKKDNNQLFIEHQIYDYGFDFEFSVINYYLNNLNKEDGKKAALKVLDSNASQDIKALTKSNLLCYNNV